MVRLTFEMLVEAFGRVKLLQNLVNRILVSMLVVREVQVHSDQAAPALENHSWIEETGAIG